MKHVVCLLLALIATVHALPHGTSYTPITIVLTRGDQPAEVVRVQLTSIGEDRRTELDPKKLTHAIETQLGKPALTNTAGTATLWAAFPFVTIPADRTTARTIRGQLTIGPAANPLYQAPLALIIPADQHNNPAILIKLDLTNPKLQDTLPVTPALPDLANAFPGEKLFNKSQMGGLHTYIYLTNLEFADLKKQLLTHLGKDWKEIDFGQHDIDRANQADGEKFKTAGNTLFKSPAHPGIQIGLTQISTEINGKKYITTLTLLHTEQE